MDDSQLVLSASRGSKDAFGSIYERYAGPIYDFLRSVMRDPDGAADVLQDSFLVAAARIHQLRDPAKLRPWLYAIARHEALRAMEKSSRHRPLEEEMEVTSTEPEPPQAAARAELAELVWAAAGGLNPRDRAVLDLHLRQGLEGQELADALGVSAGHAYVMLNRLKQQVERSLGALLVARLGRKDCEQLSALLEAWDGGFTAQLRKRVVRHVESCQRCSEVRRRAVSPLALFSAIPPVAAPAAVRERLMEQVRLVSHKGAPWPAERGGFPPESRAGRRSKWAGLAAAAVLLAALFYMPGAQSLIGRISGANAPSEPAAEVLPGAAGAAGERGEGGPAGPSIPPLIVSPIVPSSPEGDHSSPPGGPGPEGGGGTRVTDAGPGADEGGEPGADLPAPDGGSQTGSGRGPDPAPPVPTPAGADKVPPEITGMRVIPETVWAGGRCAPRGSPQKVSVEISAKDASGISGVILEWGGPSPGSAPMRDAGAGVYTATVGPFTDRTLAPGDSVRVPITAKATDSAGNSSIARGSFLLRCETAR